MRVYESFSTGSFISPGMNYTPCNLIPYSISFVFRFCGFLDAARIFASFPTVLDKWEIVAFPTYPLAPKRHVTCF